MLSSRILTLFTSYIKNLEDRVAQLELALQSHGLDAESLPDSQSAQDTYILTDASSQPQQQQHQSPSDQELLRLLMPSEQQMRQSAASGHHTLLDNIAVPAAIDFPPEQTMLKLADTYFEHSNFFSPILAEDNFRDIVSSLYQNGQGPTTGTPQQRFQLCIVLAIAILLLNRTDSAVPTSASDSFFASAISIFTARTHAIWKGDLEHLQNLLLIVQYTVFASNLSAAWHFIGLATRLAIDLDLHNGPDANLQPKETSPPNQALENKRRRIFWSTYILETNLCVVLSRPRSIPEEAIFNPLPSTTGSEASNPLANHCILFRRLESEIFQVLNYKPPMNGAVLDHHLWKSGMRDRLMDWHATVPPVDAASKLAPQSFFDGALHMTLVYLYSPSRYFPELSEDDLEYLAKYASRSIELYRIAFKEGKLRFYWRTIPNLFQSGAALIHCIKRLKSMGVAFETNELERRVSMCSTVLWGMAERYPPGASYRDRFDELSLSISDTSELISETSSTAIPLGMFSGQDIAPLDLDSISALWAATSPSLDPWIFEH